MPDEEAKYSWPNLKKIMRICVVTRTTCRPSRAVCVVHNIFVFRAPGMTVVPVFFCGEPSLFMQHFSKEIPANIR